MNRPVLAGVLALGLLPTTLLAAAKKVDPVPELDRLAETARVQWSVPGLAVVVVRDGRVLLAKGYGVRELGNSMTLTEANRVNADTLFAAGSTTKAMAVTTVGMLVDEKKLGWDDPVRKYIPELQFADATLSDSLTVRDLLTHHTGLPETDYLWYSNGLSWPGILARLKGVGPTAPLRSRFEYQNVMYGVVGDLVGRIAGMPWPEFLRHRVFQPLGMTSAVALGEEAAKSSNHATPHSREDGALVTGETLGLVDPIPAAGSVWLSANDEAKWLRFLLDPTAVKDANGEPLLAPATVEEIFRPQVVIQPGAFYPTAEKTQPKWTTYGFGWFQQDYRGRRIDFHTGSIDGMIAIVGLVRDEHFGVAVFANLDHAELRHALMLSAFDLFLEGNLSRDWNHDLRTMYDGLRSKGDADRAAFEAKRVPNAPPAHALAAYAGTYSEPLYGDIHFTLDAGKLSARVNRILIGQASPWHYETFRVAWQRKLDGVSWANFHTNDEGQVNAVEIDGHSYARQASAN